MKLHKNQIITTSIIALALSTLGLSTASAANYAESVPNNITQLGFVKINHRTPRGIKSIRLQAIRETATTLGAQGGLAWQALHLNATVNNQASYLDHIFNFQALLIDNQVLPPVISESGQSATISNPDVIRSASQSYFLISNAKVVTTAPNWRNYLEMNYQKPSPPDNTLVPRNKNEIYAWNYYLRRGWNQGIEQANTIFSANLNRLKRDYNGMILYRKLLAQGMVKAPHMAQAKLGVTGDATHLRIDDRIYRITDHSALEPNSKLWSPVITNDPT